MEKANIFLTLLLLTFMCSFSAYAENVKNVSQHITVDKRALLVLEDGSIYELLPIKPRSKSFFEYLCFSEAPTIKENLIVDLKDFPLPSFVGIPKEIMNNLNENSKNNITTATHYIHIEKDGYKEALKCQPTTSSADQKTYDSGYTYGYNIGYDYGLTDGKKKGESTGYNKGCYYCYKLDSSDTKKDY